MLRRKRVTQLKIKRTGNHARGRHSDYGPTSSQWIIGESFFRNKPLSRVT